MYEKMYFFPAFAIKKDKETISTDVKRKYSMHLTSKNLKRLVLKMNCPFTLMVCRFGA